MSIISRLILLVLLFAVTPASAQKLSDAFINIKERDLKKHYSHLAMMPVKVASDMHLSRDNKERIARQIVELLEKEKFKIIPPTETKLIRDQFVSLYPKAVTAETFAAIEEHTLREVLFQHPVKGLVRVDVHVVAAPFSKDKAQWWGASQKIEHTKEGFLGMGGGDYAGHIAASAIRVTISDRTGKPLYDWSGGVEVMMSRDGDKLEALPAERL